MLLKLRCSLGKQWHHLKVYEVVSGLLLNNSTLSLPGSVTFCQQTPHRPPLQIPVSVSLWPLATTILTVFRFECPLFVKFNNKYNIFYLYLLLHNCIFHCGSDSWEWTPLGLGLGLGFRVLNITWHGRSSRELRWTERRQAQSSSLCFLSLCGSGCLSRRTT